MLECIIMGDFIARALHLENEVFDRCKIISKGISDSRLFNENFPGSFYAETVIISLGSNDYKGIDTYEQLFQLRQRIGAKNVFWVMPLMSIPSYRIRVNGKSVQPVKIEKIQGFIKKIAEEHGDTILTTELIDQNGAEPSWQGYKEFAKRILK